MHLPNDLDLTNFSQLFLDVEYLFQQQQACAYFI